jgi:hypothetical protein
MRAPLGDIAGIAIMICVGRFAAIGRVQRKGAPDWGCPGARQRISPMAVRAGKTLPGAHNFRDLNLRTQPIGAD